MGAAEADAERAKVEVRSRAEWRAWLSAQSAQSESVWLVSWKKERGPYVPYVELRDEALCFGWVDSRPAKLDADRSMLLMSPRKRSSGWSVVNKARVAVLEAAGLMHAAGLAKVEAARRDGSWSRLDAVDALIVPDDLAAALAAHPPAAERFAAFPPSVRRGILEWIVQAKRTETRAARVEETARLAAGNVRANWAGRKCSAGGSDDRQT